MVDFFSLRSFSHGRVRVCKRMGKKVVQRLDCEKRVTVSRFVDSLFLQRLATLRWVVVRPAPLR